MSVNAKLIASPVQHRADVWQRFGLALGALTLVAGGLALLWSWLGPSATLPSRSPFGMGLRNRTSGDLGAYILMAQSAFYQSLRQALLALKEGTTIWSLLAIGFAYGIFHAAGPGHGKAVIAAYLVANERALLKALALVSLLPSCRHSWPSAW